MGVFRKPGGPLTCTGCGGSVEDIYGHRAERCVTVLRRELDEAHEREEALLRLLDEARAVARRIFALINHCGLKVKNAPEWLTNDPT